METLSEKYEILQNKLQKSEEKNAILSEENKILSKENNKVKLDIAKFNYNNGSRGEALKLVNDLTDYFYTVHYTVSKSNFFNKQIEKLNKL